MKNLNNRKKMASKIEAVHLVDQYDQSWIRISQDRRVASVPVGDLVGLNDGQTAKLVAAKGGPLVISGKDASELKRQIDGAFKTFPIKGIVVEANGWLKETGQFVSAHCALGLEHKGTPLIDIRGTNATQSKRGSLRCWKQAIRSARTNPLLGFALAASFVGPVLPFFPTMAENAGFEFEGPTSIGKSSLMRLIASVWGPPNDLLGTWDTTAAGLWVEAGASMIAVDTLVHNWLHRTGILRHLAVDHAYGPRCYAKGGCADIIEQLASSVDARQFNPEYPAYFPRFVQKAIWRFCAQAGLDQCNGNQVDDRSSCTRQDCALGEVCERVPLRSAVRQQT